MPLALDQVCKYAYIVTHNEDTSDLIHALSTEGFTVREVRGPYKPEQLTYSAIYRCLVNHANAWRLVEASGLQALIVEADFVPVLGMGRLPLPVPEDRIQWSLAYLYAVAPQFWDLPESSYCVRGHAGGMVAYVISPSVASILLEFFEEQCESNPTGTYEPWDAAVGYWLKARGIESYLPYRHYGEHGGIANPEHANAGLGRPHQADTLAGPLAFSPIYARHSWITFVRVRIRARLWGWIRLLAGRSLAWHDLIRTHPVRMFSFAFGRLMVATHRHRLR